MRHLKLTVLFFLTMVYTVGAQELKNIEKVGDFSEGFMAVSNGNSWGFIDVNGTLVINFRKDIAASPKAFPVFSNGLCLIKEKRENIIYYGYINTKGETIIPTEYIAASSFENGYARVIKNYKTATRGTNVLGKKKVSHSYNEMVIDTKNKLVVQVRGPHNLLLYKLKSQEDMPVLRSQFINDRLIAVIEDNNTYSIRKLIKK